MSHYCTFFDHRYMSRGLVMIRSLRRHAPEAQIWVLCLDAAAHDAFTHINEPGVHAIALEEFDAGDPELAAARCDGRSLVEYYFSLKPSLITYVLCAVPQAEMITYLDADLWFFASPVPIFAEAPEASVLLTPHRFPPDKAHLEFYGRFNAGWLSFRRSTEGLACLAWWRARCLEWCGDRVDEDGDRYADQRYLDKFATLFTGVHVIRHLGANLAPWNLGGRHLAQAGRVLAVDGEVVIFFHVHGLKPIGLDFYLSPADTFESGPDRQAQCTIYRPYLAALRTAERELTSETPVTEPAGQLSRWQRSGRLARMKQRLRIARAALRGHVMWIRD